MPTFVYPARATVGVCERRRDFRRVSRWRLSSARRRLSTDDATAGDAAIRLELRLTRATRADPAAEALEVLPHPAHAGQVVLELGELDLELALGADGVLGEDVEDELRPVDDASLERVLEQSLLRRLKLVVHDQHVRGRFAEGPLQLLELPLADVRPRVGPRSVLDDLVDGLDARRPGQLAELRQFLGLASGLEHGDGEPALGLRAGRRIGLPGRHRWIMPLLGRTASVRAMHVSPVLAAQTTYPFVRIEQAKRERAAEGVEIFDFGQGDPREPTDPLIQQALIDALGATKGYPKAEGLPELRDAIAGWLGRRFGISVDPAAEIVPTLGSKEAIFSFAQVVRRSARPERTRCS